MSQLLKNTDKNIPNKLLSLTKNNVKSCKNRQSIQMSTISINFDFLIIFLVC